MNPIVRNIIAVVAGLLVGGFVNMLIVFLGPHIIHPPAGAILTTMEGLKASMHLMEPKHFIMPFLAHALGTLVGAYIATKIAVTYKMVFALAIGCSFLVGGIMNIYMLPSPLWFTIIDLLIAYIPMAWIGWKITILAKK